MSKKNVDLAALDEKIKVVFLQVRLSEKSVPSLFREVAYTPSVPAVGKPAGNQQTGAIFIRPTERVEALPLVDDLRREGFVLVDAMCELRERVYAIRFVFSRDQDQIQKSAVKRLWLDRLVRPEIARLLGVAVYNVVAYRNPSMWMGEIIKGREHVSINLNARNQDVPPLCRLSIVDNRIVVTAGE